MVNSDITVFAETTFRNRKLKFGIKTDDRRRHMYLIGKTGMGKSTILENMIIDDIRAGRGVAVVDPHGDLAEKVMQYIPAERIKDVIYFNPTDTDFPIAFNIVEAVDIKVRHLVASGLVGVFKKLWADSWGPRLEYILRNAILAVLDYPNSTLLSVIQMLSDKAYRKKVLAEVKDPVVKAFWIKEFAGYADKFASEAVSPIQNKVGQFLSSSVIRNIVGQTRSSIDVRRAMDEGKILIMNLSKGHIGEDNSALLGAMMITKIQLAAMSRVDIPEKERRDFYLYIDEFQNFSTESFATILSEARKYHLNLIIAHQYMEQLTDEVKAAVFGNVGTLVSFRVGAIDAEELVKEYTPVFEEEDILNLPKYEFYIKLMIDGVASSPFSARGLPPLTEEERTNNLQKAIDWTRQNYAKPQVEVEDEIMRVHFTEDVPKPPVKEGTIKTISAEAGFAAPLPNRTIAPAATPAPYKPIATVPFKPAVMAPKKEEKKIQLAPISKPHQEQPSAYQPKPKTETRPAANFFATRCSICGEETKIPFKPDGVRPIYCKNCLSDLKNKKREGGAPLGVEKKERIDFSGISPSALLRQGAISNDSTEEGYISLAKFKENGLDVLNNHSKTEVEKKPLPAEANNKEKDLAEGEDIVFE